MSLIGLSHGVVSACATSGSEVFLMPYTMQQFISLEEHDSSTSAVQLSGFVTLPLAEGLYKANGLQKGCQIKAV